MKFKIAGKEVFRSKTIHKNLNPVWDERVSLLVETLRDPLYVKVQQMGPGLQMSSCCSMNCCHTLDDCSVSIDKNWLYSMSIFMPDMTSQCKKYVRLVTFAYLWVHCWQSLYIVFLQVFDYDFGFQDDFMGSAYLHLESLEHQRSLCLFWLLSFLFSQLTHHQYLTLLQSKLSPLCLHQWDWKYCIW